MGKLWGLTGLVLLSFCAGSAEADVVRFGKSLRLDHERLGLYHLEGSAYEVGYAAGRLTPSEALKTGMIPYMSKFVQSTVFQSGIVRANAWLKPLLDWYLDLTYYSKLKRRVEQDERDFLQGMNEASGMDPKVSLLAMLNPDVSHLLIGDFMSGRFLFGIGAPKKKHPPHYDYQPRSLFGCSTFVVPSSRSADGHAIFARVQDYPGVGLFDAYPAVYYVAKPGRYRYVTVSSGGIATGGITAMNEHGLTLSVHSGLSLDADVAGHPLLSVSSRMMEQARDIDEAVAICNGSVPASGWLMNLADVKDGKSRAARIEVNPKDRSCHVEFEKDVLFTTNDYFDAHNRSHEVSVGPSFDNDGGNRLQRLRELVAESGPKISVERSMQILADRKDPEMNRYMSYAPGGVAALHQIAAVVFRPETRELWVSNGVAPPASNGHYIHFNLSDFEDLEGYERQPQVADIDIDQLLKGTPNDVSHRPALFAFREAFRVFDSNGVKDPALALSFVSQAVQYEPDEPFYRMARALLELGQRKIADGVADLEQVINDPRLDAHRRNVSKLYLAKGLDVLGHRTEAVAIYQALAGDSSVFEAIRDVAGMYLKKRCTAGKLDGIDPDLRFADTISYD